MTDHSNRSINWTKRLLVLGLLLLLLGVGLTPAQALLRIQPQLMVMAAQSPEQVVAVIVQKQTQSRALEETTARLGGRVTQDLHIINAFAAELPAGAVKELAQAGGVRWISLDAPMVRSGGPDGSFSSASLLSAYQKSVRVEKVWSDGYQGSGVTVAVVDSGIVPNNDFKELYGGGGAKRVRAYRNVVSGSADELDNYGHGTHVAGIIGGNGTNGGGERRYVGIAPKVNLIAVNVIGADGSATMSNVVAGLQWINDNRALHNIKVVNLSLNSSVAESYHTNPLDAASEILWFNGIVVVVSAGNNGNNGLFPPANDPFVITVGAVDDKGTTSIGDDVIPSFSAYGTTANGVTKPDLVAPGKNIVSVLSKADAALSTEHPDFKVYSFSGSQDYYFKMSGTSVSAPIVSGAVALMLQKSPSLNPDQVKYRLKATARGASMWSGYNAAKAGAGYLDVDAAFKSTATNTANTGYQVSNLLNTGSSPVGQTWGSVNWSSVNWSSVNWSSVNWSSVNWSSVNWASDYWGN